MAGDLPGEVGQDGQGGCAEGELGRDLAELFEDGVHMWRVESVTDLQSGGTSILGNEVLADLFEAVVIS